MDKGFSSHSLEAFDGAEMLCAACCVAEQSRRYVEEFVRQRYLPCKDGKVRRCGSRPPSHDAASVA